MAPGQVGAMNLGFLDREGRGMAMGFNGQPCCFVSINMGLAKPGTMAIISLRRWKFPDD
ncbi:MAG: hypothetical protein ACKVKR_14475 [Pseudomonadales bacterium]